MTAPHRRSACPGLSAPMSTGDGLLVRLLPADRIPLDAFIAICAAARAHGNGAIEITARGSLQLRGLTLRSAPLLASDIAALDIAAIEGVPVIADPLAGDPDALIDAAGLAATLRRAIADARLALAPKVSVVVDGGGRLHLDALSADLRLRAIGPPGRRACMWRWPAMPDRRRRSDRSRPTRLPMWRCVCSARLPRRGARRAPPIFFVPREFAPSAPSSMARSILRRCCRRGRRPNRSADIRSGTARLRSGSRLPSAMPMRTLSSNWPALAPPTALVPCGRPRAARCYCSASRRSAQRPWPPRPSGSASWCA